MTISLSKEGREYLRQLDNLVTEADVDTLPHLVVEEIKDQCISEINPSSLPTEGGLSSKRLHMIKRVHIIEPSRAQFYAVRNFRTSPHYNLGRNLEKLFVKACSMHKIPISRYRSSKSYIHHKSKDANNDDGYPFVKVVNYGTSEFVDIAHLHWSLELCEPSRKVTSGPGSRGNQIHSWGFTGVSTHRDPSKGVFSGKPQTKTLDCEELKWTVTLSEMTRVLKLPITEHMDDDRLRLFAASIDQRNIFEGGVRGRNVSGKNNSFVADANTIDGKTVKSAAGRRSNEDTRYEETPTVGDFTTCHVDKDNCSEPGFEWQVVASAVFIHGGSLMREFVGAYGRKACHQYTIREHTSEFIADKVKNYLDSCDPGLGSIDLKTFERKSVLIDDTAGWRDKDKLFAAETCADKSTLYSYFTEVGERLAKHNPNYWRRIEASLCVGLCSAMDVFWIVFRRLKKRNRLKDGHSWVVEFHKEMAKCGGCSFGEIKRLVPHYNDLVSNVDLIKALVSIHWIVTEVNDMQLPEHDHSEENKRVYRECFLDLLKKISKSLPCKGIGELTGQHVLQFLIYSGTIRHAALGNYAKFAVTTETWSKLVEEIGGMPPNKDQSQRLLRDVAGHCCTSERVVENCVCEMLKKEKRRKAPMDPMINGQTFYSPKTSFEDGLPVSTKIHRLNKETGQWEFFKPRKIDPASCLPETDGNDVLEWWKYVNMSLTEIDESFAGHDLLQIPVHRCDKDKKKVKKAKTQRTIPVAFGEETEFRLKNEFVFYKRDWKRWRDLNYPQPTIFSPAIPTLARESPKKKEDGKLAVQQLAEMEKNGEIIVRGELRRLIEKVNKPTILHWMNRNQWQHKFHKTFTKDEVLAVLFIQLSYEENAEYLAKIMEDVNFNKATVAALRKNAAKKQTKRTIQKVQGESTQRKKTKLKNTSCTNEPAIIRATRPNDARSVPSNDSMTKLRNRSTPVYSSRWPTHPPFVTIRLG